MKLKLIFLLLAGWQLFSITTCGCLKLCEATTKAGGLSSAFYWRRVKVGKMRHYCSLDMRGKSISDAHITLADRFPQSDRCRGGTPWRQYRKCVKCGLLMACLTGHSGLIYARRLYTRLYVLSQCLRLRDTPPLVSDRLKAREEDVFR